MVLEVVLEVVLELVEPALEREAAAETAVALVLGRSVDPAAVLGREACSSGSTGAGQGLFGREVGWSFI
ncbi:MAG: hypothetical protein U0Q03_18065 [Acidimicrobiales bacterium]